MKDILGIIGGLGPQASSYFYDMITNRIVAEKDQDHLDIVLLSHSSIPDRTQYILDNTKEDPYPYLLEDIKILEKLGAKMVVIPCNTSCYFYERLQSQTSVIINNMVEDTVLYVKNKNIKKVAIMATDGTIKSSLYQNACKKFGIECEIPTADIQEQIMKIIYDYVKTGKDINIYDWNNIIKSFSSEVVILGCTELSYLKKILKLDEKFVDPLEVETSKVLNFFNKKEK